MAAMTRFAILLGGKLMVTPRLLGQLAGARVIAADSGMAHAGPLGVTPELWVGDFDSADASLIARHRDVPREAHPPDKDATDGSLAIASAISRGGDDFVLAGGLGGQADHTLGHFGQILYLARIGLPGFITSGDEEAHPIVPGTTTLDIPPQSRLSLIPFVDLGGLTLEGVRWPLSSRDVPLGSTLTLSNVVLGPVRIELRSGHAIAVAYPQIPNA
jgi:thiamine pyrophosphokinase